MTATSGAKAPLLEALIGTAEAVPYPKQLMKPALRELWNEASRYLQCNQPYDLQNQLCDNLWNPSKIGCLGV